MRSSCYTLLGSCPPTLGLHPNGNPPCGDCVKPFFVRHRGRLNASIRHCVPGPACTLFCRSFALRLIPHHDDFRHDTTFHLGLGCPTCSTGTHEPTECNRPTVFHGATATRLMAIGSIDADLRIMSPITLFRGQSCHRVARSITLSSACGHSAANLIPRTLLLPFPVARWQKVSRSHLEFACPPFLLTCASRSAFLEGAGYYPCRVYRVPPDLT